jgi:hypothetical protein
VDYGNTLGGMMTSLQAFLLGIMIYLTPSMALLALMLCRLPDAEQMPTAPPQEA